MRKILICALALTLGACGQAPYTPATKIPAVNLKPVRDRIVAIKVGNDKIGEKLGDTRSKLDAAIVEARNAQIDLDALNKRLDEASAALDATLAVQKVQAETIQFAAVDLDRAQEEADTFKLRADAQTDQLNAALPRLANYEAQEKLDKRWWGFGYFIHGVKYMGWRILILLVVLAIISFLLNMFVPALSPLFSAAVKFFVSLPGRIIRFIIGIFKKKPPA